MSHARMRLLRDMVLDAGLEIVSTGTKNNRVAIEAKAPNGLTRTFQLSTSSRIDPRGDMNEHGRIKRFARENPAPGAAPQHDEDEMPKATPAAQELTPVEFYKLCERVKQADLSKFADIEIAAQSASTYSEKVISVDVLREAMGATDTPEPEAWTKLPEPAALLARELAAIQAALGQEPSALFKRYLETLGA